MKTEINEIKNKIYEAEGLLELLQLREEKLGELSPLILARLDEARTLMAGLDKTDTVTVTEPSDVISITADVEAEIEEVKPAVTVTAEKTVTPESRRKPAFTLNDKFRFRRGLFGGSDSQFNAAMDQVAAMESYEEAEEYFIDDLGFDPEADDVIAFMDIIKEYFTR